MGPVLSALSSLELEMIEQDFGTTAVAVIEAPRSQAPRRLRELKAAIAGVYLAEIDDDFQIPGLTIQTLGLRSNI